jgi:hypothetical protein
MSRQMPRTIIRPPDLRVLNSTVDLQSLCLPAAAAAAITDSAGQQQD